MAPQLLYWGVFGAAKGVEPLAWGEADAEQLELLLAVEGTAPVSTRALRAEHRRLGGLLAMLGGARRDPKREAFVAARQATEAQVA